MPHAEHDAQDLNRRRIGRVSEKILGGALAPGFRTVQPNLAKVQSLFPLQVGKRVAFDYRGPSVTGEINSWSYVLSVEKYEPVTTSAGVFPCYVILYSEET